MELNFIKEKVFETVDFEYIGEIVFSDFDGIKVTCDGNKACISSNSLSGYARGCFLFAMNISEGKDRFEICEKPHFKSCGVMLDCSRNAVMKPEAVKKYINCLAALGMNTLLLYTEDTFEVEGRARFGYLRGRYTHDELKEIVDYGERMGVELIPHIQTLGHLYQYIKWSRIGAPDYTGENIYGLTDTSSVILCESDETYRFIEDMIKTCRMCFKSNRIHIGMDEAHDLGLGQYKNLHGFCDRLDIMTKHLRRVVEICDKYGFKPLMYSDMFFRLANRNGIYEDASVKLPDEIKNMIPDCELFFWDYYRKDKSYYDAMLSKHKLFEKSIAFMGGLGTWYGYLPAHSYAERNTRPALLSCLEHGVDTVIASAWGDDGNETNAFLSNSLLTLYSEYCYKGTECTQDDIARASGFLTKMSFEDAKAMSSLCYDTEYTPEGFMIGKRIFYGDILYDMAIDASAAHEAIDIYGRCRDRMAELMQKKDKNYDNYNYAYLLYSICRIKAGLAQNLRASYKAGDRRYLEKTRDEYLPELISLLDNLFEAHKKQWLSTYKPFGFEVLTYRYGGLKKRIEFVMETISSYLDGNIQKITELTQDILVNEGGYLQGAACVMTPSYRL